jgi:hypothetical protein
MKSHTDTAANLFGWRDQPPVYPNSPGWKGGETSREAGNAISADAKNLRGKVLSLMRDLAPEALTADQIAIRLRRSILSVRPRVSELARLGKLVSVEERGKNESGMSARKWRAA